MTAAHSDAPNAATYRMHLNLADHASQEYLAMAESLCELLIEAAKDDTDRYGDDTLAGGIAAVQHLVGRAMKEVHDYADEVGAGHYGGRFARRATTAAPT